eukprot:245024-Amphidinium_carterae.1
MSIGFGLDHKSKVRVNALAVTMQLLGKRCLTRYIPIWPSLARDGQLKAGWQDVGLEECLSPSCRSS